MAETDISKIINLIMTNPGLIEEIKRLSKDESEKSSAAEATEEKEVAAETVADAENEAALNPTIEKASGEKAKRNELLRALKPYVKEGRGRAIESMITIADILEVMREK